MDLGSGGLVLVLGPVGLALVTGLIGRIMVLRHRANRTTLEQARGAREDNGNGGE